MLLLLLLLLLQRRRQQCIAVLDSVVVRSGGSSGLVLALAVLEQTGRDGGAWDEVRGRHGAAVAHITSRIAVVCICTEHRPHPCTTRLIGNGGDASAAVAFAAATPPPPLITLIIITTTIAITITITIATTTVTVVLASASGGAGAAKRDLSPHAAVHATAVPRHAWLRAQACALALWRRVQEATACCILWSRQHGSAVAVASSAAPARAVCVGRGCCSCGRGWRARGRAAGAAALRARAAKGHGGDERSGFWRIKEERRWSVLATCGRQQR